MDVKVIGRIRKLLEGVDSGSQGDDEQFALTPQLEQLVAFGAAPYREVTRLGRCFVVNTASAVAAVVAIPTTTGMVSLYNNEPDGGRSYIIDWVAASNVASAATAAQAQILVLPGQVREAIPTDAALAIKKMNGYGSGTDTKARTILTGTALPGTTGLATNWLPWGPSVAKLGVAATPGYGLWAPIDGRIIVPPGRYFSMNVLANVTGETFQGYISWHEAQLTVG